MAWQDACLFSWDDRTAVLKTLVTMDRGPRKNLRKRRYKAERPKEYREANKSLEGPEESKEGLFSSVVFIILIHMSVPHFMKLEGNTVMIPSDKLESLVKMVPRHGGG